MVPSKQVDELLNVNAHPILRSIQEDLKAQGFDLCFLFSTNWMKGVHTPTEELLLPSWKNRLALLIGNTRSFWPPFIEALRKDPSLLNSGDPIDEYSTRTISAIWKKHLGDGNNDNDHDVNETEIFWQQHTPGQPLLSMQHIASVTGVYHFDEVQFLCVHPTFGPWTAFRAVAIFPQEFVTMNLSKAVGAIIHSPNPEVPPNMCLEHGCFEASRQALDDAFKVAESDRKRSSDIAVKCVHKADNWKIWATVRLVCRIGKTYEYSDDQLEYHYTAKKHVLVRALSKARNETNT
jgi:hypothetical protein